MRRGAKAAIPAVMAAAEGTDVNTICKALCALAAVLALSACASLPASRPAPAWAVAVHGGAGVILRENLTPEEDAALRASLSRALGAGAGVLESGGSALDAVTAAILVMEDDPQFNAGKGAVFTEDGTHELDAAIMDGRDRNAGAVAGVTIVRHPILAARAVMEASPHVMFAGPGADAFALAQGLESVPNDWFDTESRRAALERVLATRRRTSADKSGTVGAIARDMSGSLAAGTSTGGMTAKAAGRVGDAPLIGAATYAQNGVCAVSSTGHGEYFIRVGVARTICERMSLLGESGQQAAQFALGEVAALGGDGGVIVMDAQGRVSFVFNSPGMYRGRKSPDGEAVAIYGDGE